MGIIGFELNTNLKSTENKAAQSASSNNKPNLNNEPVSIMIIDDFSQKDCIDINGDGIKETHGDLVTAVFRAGAFKGSPNTPYKITKENVWDSKPKLPINENNYDNAVTNTFTSLSNKAKIADITNYSSALPIAPDRDLSRLHPDNKKDLELYKTITQKTPGPDFTGAGNNPETINLYATVDGATTIGGLSPDNQIDDSSSYKKFVDKGAPYCFEVAPVHYDFKKNGVSDPKVIGFDVYPEGKQGDGIPDLYINEVSGGVNQKKNIAPKLICGTSFSSPYEAGRSIGDFFNQRNKAQVPNKP